MTVLRGQILPGRTRRVRREGRFVVRVVICVVLLAAGVAEFVVRHQVAGRIAGRMEQRLGTGVDVGLGWTPVMFQMARGSFGQVEVEGHDATFRRFAGVDLDAELDSVVRTGKGLKVGSSQVRAEMSDEALAGTVAGAAGGAGAATVTADPGSSQLVVHAGPAGRLTVAFRPSLDHDAIRLERTAVRFGERELPEGLAGQLLQGAPEKVDLSGLPLGLKPQKLTVTDDGLRLDLTGGNATVKG
ncbi:DUF2993 domain-containing protein [Streptomyces sp. NPDC050095]|uniref:LmeA family phospholipid-binding protein n=1 Tax=unclassified Streptomyces TaxID=2593676 RepID=UPI00342AE74F